MLTRHRPGMFVCEDTNGFYPGPVWLCGGFLYLHRAAGILAGLGFSSEMQTRATRSVSQVVVLVTGDIIHY